MQRWATGITDPQKALRRHSSWAALCASAQNRASWANTYGQSCVGNHLSHRAVACCGLASVIAGTLFHAPTDSQYGGKHHTIPHTGSLHILASAHHAPAVLLLAARCHSANSASTSVISDRPHQATIGPLLAVLCDTFEHKQDHPVT